MTDQHDPDTGEVDMMEPRRENFGDMMTQQEVLPPGGGQLTPRQVNDMFGAIITAQPNIVPRNHKALMQRLKALSASFGDGYLYSWEVKGKNAGIIEGGTIKLANDLCREYGNCCVDVREIDFPTHWVFYSRFSDLETGFTMTRAFRQRKSQSTGKMDQDRALDIAYQIGQSKAIRNVVLNALANYSEFMMDEARDNLLESIRSNPDKAHKKIDAVMAKFGIDLASVEAAVGRPRKDWIVRDTAQVYTKMVGIWDGLNVASDVFPKDGAQIPAAETNTETTASNGDGAAEAEGESGGKDSGKSPRASDSPEPAKETTEKKAAPAKAEPAKTEAATTGKKTAAPKPKALF